MKKYLTLLLLLISFSLLTGACTKSPEISPNPTQPKIETPKTNPTTPTTPTAPVLKPEDFFPLVQGALWEYEGEGNEYASFNRRVVYSNGDLAQISEDNGGTVSAAVFKITPEAVTRTFFQGEAYNATNLLPTESNENLIILKLPLKVGTKWNTTKDIREITDINASVNTPAGKFTQCIKVKISYEDSTVFEYFKSGIGMVKREFISGDTKVTSTLKKYTKGS